MARQKKQLTMTELLRDALAKAESMAEVERQTGVKRQSLMKFARGEQSLRLDMADRLARYFGIQIAWPFPWASQGPIKAFEAEGRSEDFVTLALQFALRLMVAVECTRSSIRLFERIEREAGHAAEADRIVVSMAMMGWGGEITKLIREGHKKRHLRHSQLSDGSRYVQLWDDVIENRGIVRDLVWIRDKTFAHWDKGIAKQCIKRLAQEHERSPIIDTWNDGETLSTRFPWAFESIAATIVDIDAPQAAWAKKLKQIAGTVGGLVGLSSELVSSLIQDSDLTFQPKR